MMRDSELTNPSLDYMARIPDGLTTSMTFTFRLIAVVQRTRSYIRNGAQISPTPEANVDVQRLT